MSISLLTTSSINSFVENFRIAERNKLIKPLDVRKNRYTSLSSSYETLRTKLASLLSSLSALKQSGTDSVFAAKAAVSSNNKTITAAASNDAITGSYNARVIQLAKNDTLVSSSFLKEASVDAAGIHSFLIKTGDGNGGTFFSNVEVELTGSETYSSVMNKLRDAINGHKAVVKSNYVNGNTVYAGGASSFTINLNGTETEFTIDTSGTYSDLFDEIVSQINEKAAGVTAVKVSDENNPSDYRIELTVNDSSKYISITHNSGFDLISELGIGVEKLKGASGMISASVFSPVSGSNQITLASKEAGLDLRINEISDNEGSGLLGLLNLNLGTVRTEFNQSENTAGYLFSDISGENNLLNAKFIFNGISIQRNSNKINDLVNGLTLTLHSVTSESDPDTNINITVDTAGIKSKIEDFIKRFNDIYTYIRTQRTAKSNGERGVFHSDVQASTILSIFSEIGYSPVTGLSGSDLSYLSQIGISFNPLTGLSISDTNLFEQRISENTSQAEALFNSANGIAASLYGKIEPYTGVEGFLAIAKASFENNILSLNDRIDAAQKRIDKSAAALRKHYEALQIQLASLLSVQNMFSTGNNFF